YFSIPIVSPYADNKNRQRCHMFGTRKRSHKTKTCRKAPFSEQNFCGLSAVASIPGNGGKVEKKYFSIPIVSPYADNKNRQRCHMFGTRKRSHKTKTCRKAPFSEQNFCGLSAVASIPGNGGKAEKKYFSIPIVSPYADNKNRPRCHMFGTRKRSHKTKTCRKAPFSKQNFCGLSAVVSIHGDGGKYFSIPIVSPYADNKNRPRCHMFGTRKRSHKTKTCRKAPFSKQNFCGLSAVASIHGDGGKVEKK
ncbi:hypothetical protein QYM36_005386, partial [Artemia franciscana]